jgi:DNA-binding MarR family transcriptional regulator
MLSRIVGKLVNAGLLRRVPDPDDGRAALVEATPAGVNLHEQRRLERTRLLLRVLDQIPADDASALIAVLPTLETLADADPAQHADSPAP